MFSLIAALTHLVLDQLAAILGFSAANFSKSITPQVAGLVESSSSGFFGKGREMSSKGGKASALATSAAVAVSGDLAAVASANARFLVCQTRLDLGLSPSLPSASFVSASVGISCSSSSTEAGELLEGGVAGRNKAGSSAGAAREALASGAASALFLGGNKVGLDNCAGTGASASAGSDSPG